MNILSIGNSFSQDAQRYLRRIAKADRVDLQTFNLYIGGCSLARHYRNMLSGQKEYLLEMNGENTGFKVSLEEALLNRDWDVVTLQQASPESPQYDTYQPYLSALAEYVRRCVPKAKIVVHQTWAYEQDSYRLNVELGYRRHTEMFADLKAAYEQAAEAIRADGIIPSGEVFQSLLAAGIEKVHRDTFHAHRGIGRYALGLLWYAVLTGRDVMGNTFADFDVEITPQQVETAKRCVMEICRKNP
ncbi:MAG: DUF4886 domain-containing protein [Oscillospiraceae bacterium]|nr:DUF4886 domain-containing protein [Oscillospiraceae bacterium]